jgi:hypothetical protein
MPLKGRAYLIERYCLNLLGPGFHGVKGQVIPGNAREVIQQFAIAIESQWITID